MLRYLVKDTWNDKTNEVVWRIWDNVKGEFTFTLYKTYERAKVVANKKNGI